MTLSALKNLHLPDHVAARDAVDDRQSLDDLPKDGVAAVQMRLRGVRDEKLAAAGVLARKSHPDRAANVRPGVYLASDLIAGAAFAVAARIASLNNEIRNDAVKSEAVEEALARERNEAVYRDRSVLREEFDPDPALGGVTRGGDFLVEARGRPLMDGFAVARLNDADSVGKTARAHPIEQIDGMAAYQVILVGERGFHRFDCPRRFVFGERTERGQFGVVLLVGPTLREDIDQRVEIFIALQVAEQARDSRAHADVSKRRLLAQNVRHPRGFKFGKRA